MNAFMRFAKAMSEELFTMRSVDIQQVSLYIEDQHGEEVIIDNEYKDKVLLDPVHSAAIKERLRMSVLADVQQNPDEYDMNGTEYVYSGYIYDHAYQMDNYIQDQFKKDHPEFKTIMVCDTCGSDNVQSRVWVRPNQNNEFVDLMSEEVQDNFCDDCNQNVSTTNIEIDTRHKVIGFQVVSMDGLVSELHPAMTSDKSLYSLEQANEMLNDRTVHGEWELVAIWTADVKNPVIMFEGDPRKL